MPKRAFMLSVAAAVAILTVACSSTKSADSPAGETQEVTVNLSELKFEPARLSVRAGRPVKMTLNNVGTAEHDLVITGMPAKDVSRPTGGHAEHGGSNVLEIAGHTQPKGQGVIRFTPTQTGTYEMICSLPGHKDAGMRGTLSVS